MAATIRDFLSEPQLQRVRGMNGFCSRPPRIAYRDQGFMQYEQNAWLDRTWMLVGRAHEIPEPGDAMPVPGHPVFLVRGEDRRVRAFHNACRHRGHELVSAPCKQARRIVCPYHHWTYDLDGTLVAIPHFAGEKGDLLPQFDFASWGLKSIRCELWHNWIFINVDGTAVSLDEFVGPMAKAFDDVDFPYLKHFSTISKHPLSTNWKIAMENNVEPYHVPMVHAKTAAGQPLSKHQVIDDGPLVGCMINIPGAPYTNRAAAKTSKHLDTSSRYILRVPNLYLTSHAPDKIVDSIILPDRESPCRCWVSHAIYSTSGEDMTAHEIELWCELENQVLIEDLAVMEGVAKGMRSPVPDDGGVLSSAWESCIIGFYRNMLSALDHETLDTCA